MVPPFSLEKLGIFKIYCLIYHHLNIGAKPFSVGLKQYLEIFATKAPIRTHYLNKGV
jgi:hypothetical protein